MNDIESKISYFIENQFPSFYKEEGDTEKSQDCTKDSVEKVVGETIERETRRFEGIQWKQNQ